MELGLFPFRVFSTLMTARAAPGHRLEKSGKTLESRVTKESTLNGNEVDKKLPSNTVLLLSNLTAFSNTTASCSALTWSKCCEIITVIGLK